MVIFFVVVFIVLPLTVGWLRGRAAEAQARRDQNWREQTIANGILRAKAIEGEIMAQAVARSRPMADVVDPAATQQLVRRAQRSFYAERISTDGDFERLLNK